MSNTQAPDFRELADRIAGEIAADLAAGRRRPGDRLPPSRAFAHAQGIAASTASRVYAELVRRGLAVGEVGRGTFLRATPPSPIPAAAGLPARDQEVPGLVDLEMNFSVLPEEPELLSPILSGLLAPGALMQGLMHVPVHGTAAARRVAASATGGGGWTPEPESLLFAGSGRQGVAAAFAALASAGERVGFESLTYSAARGMAQRLGLLPVPIAMDGEGLRPDALAAAHRAAPLRAVYVQPTLHNPLGVTMGAARREELAAVLRETGIVAVEDIVYAFLADPGAPPPLASFAQDRVVLVDSLSKRVAPGLTLGFVAAPPALRDRVGAALRLGAWQGTGFALAAGIAWIEAGVVAELSRRKRADAAARFALARRILAEEGGLALRGDARAYHAWLELPGGWRAETFVAAAARRRIAVSPAAAFAVGPGHAPDAVRIALAAPEAGALPAALETLRGLALAGPDALAME